MEKMYIVKINDSVESDKDEYFIELAKNALLKRKTAYAAIYAYRDSDGNKVYFAEPLIKYSQDDVNQFTSGLLNGKKGTDKVIYAIYRNQLD